jgi:hypothetical protein
MPKTGSIAAAAWQSLSIASLVNHNTVQQSYLQQSRRSSTWVMGYMIVVSFRHDRWQELRTITTFTASAV